MKHKYSFVAVATAALLCLGISLQIKSASAENATALQAVVLNVPMT